MNKKKCMTKGGSWRIFPPSKCRLCYHFLFLQPTDYGLAVFSIAQTSTSYSCFVLLLPQMISDTDSSKWYRQKKNFVEKISELENVCDSQLDGHFMSHCAEPEHDYSNFKHCFFFFFYPRMIYGCMQDFLVHL